MATGTHKWRQYLAFLLVLTTSLLGLSMLWRGVPKNITDWIDSAKLALLFALTYMLVGGLIQRLRKRVTEERAGLHSGWRPCPFVVGKKYRPVAAFRADRDAFSAGELLTFVKTAYSRHDGMTGYFFEDSEGRLRAWDVHDKIDLSTHPKRFEEVAAS